LIGSFIRWWTSELVGLVPAGLRRAPRRRGRVLRFDVGPGATRVVHSVDGREQELGSIERGEGDRPAPGNEALGSMIAGLDPDSTLCEIRAAPGLALTRELELPAAARENLREVLGFEMERRTPFRVDEVHFGFSAASAPDESERIAVRLCVIPRRVSEPVFRLLEGWELSAAEAPALEDEGAVTLAFRAPGYRARGGGGLAVALALLNVAALVAVVAIPLYQQHQLTAALRADLAEARAAATRALEVRERLDATRAEIEFLADVRGRRPTAVELVEELSARLPDSTWLHRLEIDGAEVRLQGASGEASSLIAILEDSDSLAEVRFLSPVVREGNTGRDRFHVAAGVPGREAPAPPPAADGDSR
jgi:general secretion pathway protein L